MLQVLVSAITHGTQVGSEGIIAILIGLVPKRHRQPCECCSAPKRQWRSSRALAVTAAGV